MGWKREGKLLVPSDDVTTEKNQQGDQVTPEGIIVPADSIQQKVPRHIRRMITKIENREKKKEAKKRTREMLRNRWLPLVIPKEGHASGNKGEKIVGESV